MTKTFLRTLATFGALFYGLYLYGIHGAIRCFNGTSKRDFGFYVPAFLTNFVLLALTSFLIIKSCL